MAGYDEGVLSEEINVFLHGGGLRCAWGILFLRFVNFAMVVGHTMHPGRTLWFVWRVSCSIKVDSSASGWYGSSSSESDFPCSWQNKHDTCEHFVASSGKVFMISVKQCGGSVSFCYI